MITREQREAMENAIGLFVTIHDAGYYRDKIDETLPVLRTALSQEPEQPAAEDGLRVGDRFVTQTKLGFGEHLPPDEQGDCTESAVATYLGVPRESVPMFHGSDGPMGFWDRFDAYFASLGYMAHRFDGHWNFNCLHLASGTTVRGSRHMVVMRDGKLFHDPHPSRAGLLTIDMVHIAVPLDPMQWMPLPTPPNTAAINPSKKPDSIDTSGVHLDGVDTSGMTPFNVSVLPHLLACERTAVALEKEAADPLAADARDAVRLKWMIKHGAEVSQNYSTLEWTCQWFTSQLEGAALQGQGWFKDPISAIDAAMQSQADAREGAE